MPVDRLMTCESGTWERVSLMVLASSPSGGDQSAAAGTAVIRVLRCAACPDGHSHGCR